MKKKNLQSGRRGQGGEHSDRKAKRRMKRTKEETKKRERNKLKATNYTVFKKKGK